MTEIPVIAGLTIAKRENDRVEIMVGPEAGEGALLRLLHNKGICHTGSPRNGGPTVQPWSSHRIQRR